MKKNKVFSLSLSKRIGMYGYLFILPLLIGLLFIFLPCFIQSLYYAFCDVKISFNDVSTTFVGFGNFKEAFLSDVSYREILLNTIRGTIVDTIIILSFSFFVSSILNQKFAGRGIARAIFFLPVILSTGIVAAVDTATTSAMVDAVGSTAGSAFGGDAFSSFFDLEAMLLSMNLPQGITSIITYAVDNTYTIVNRSGVQILIFLSALQGIPASIFEASKMEGATKWEEFWKITFPMITPMILVNTIYTIIDSFTDPSYGMLEYVQEQMFVRNKMGYASAVSWVYFVIILILLLILLKITAKKITYTNK